jgi:PAS domain S-box-containing protein
MNAEGASSDHRLRSSLHISLAGFVLITLTIAAAYLVVTVGIEAAALAPWRHQSTIIVIIALCTVIGFGVLSQLLAAQIRKLELRSSVLAQSEERFRSFALASSDWFWESDEQHRITYVSEGILAFGQDPASRIGKSRVELAADAGSDAAKWQEHIAVMNRHEPFRNFVYTRKVREQPEHTVSVSGDPFFDPAGRFLGYRGTARDITQQIAAERVLREAKSAAEAANRARSQFLANMSHELRTPLNAIIGFAHAIKGGVAGPLNPRLAEYAEYIHQSGEHLLHIITDILDLSKVDAGKLDLQEEHGIDPQRVASTCVSLMRDRAKSGTVQLLTEIEDNLPLLTADPTRLNQILLNLLSNAVKFTEPDGSVVLAVHRAKAGGVEFEVRDTGLGMTTAEIAIALEPFSQVDASFDRRSQGTGLGLPLARRLAELHDGSISIASEKGRGTTVILTLPATRISGDAAARSAQFR